LEKFTQQKSIEDQPTETHKEKKVDEKRETKNNDKGDNSLQMLPQNENVSQEPTLKPKKQKTEKKGKIENKSSEEVLSRQHALDKENEKAKEK